MGKMLGEIKTKTIEPRIYSIVWNGFMPSSPIPNESIKKNKHKFNLPDWFLSAYHNQTLIIDKLNKLLRNDRSNN